MKSKKPGTNTSPAEVTHVSSHGVWLLVDEAEYFLPYADYPWFKEATIAGIMHVRPPHPQHLHWPDLDVDLELDSLKSPAGYPLVYR